MTTFVVAGDRNFDTCYTAAGAVAAPSSNATLDIFNINGAKLIVDTDTRYAPGRVGSVTAGGSGSVDTVTVSAALGGEFLIDGTNAKIIPYVSGTGTPNTQTAGLYTSALAWAGGVVTATTSAVHSLTTGDWVAIGGAEPNGYNGLFQVTVTTTTAFTYELVTDPGISTVTNATAVKYWYARQLQGATKAVTARTYGTNVATYTSTAHGFLNGDWVVIAGVTPIAHNGLFQVSGVTTNTFNVTRTIDPGAITVSGTAQEAAQGTFLGQYSAFNVAANPPGIGAGAAVSATGFIKIKNVKGIFVAGSTINIQGGTACSVVAADTQKPGWIEVCGASTGIMTIPRLGKFTVTGDWFYPLLAPVVTTALSSTGTTATATVANTFTVGSKVTISGASVAGYNGTYTIVSASGTQFTYTTAGSNLGAATTAYVVCEQCTTGVAAATGIQLPASTVLTYYPGVWVETAVGSNTFEFYPSAGSYATAGQSTNAALGKMCWITTQGAVRFGHDGTQANGYLPPAGLRIRTPNINFMNTTRAATPGVGPNIANTATMTARQTFVSTGGNTGVINIDKCNSSWYLNFQQTSSITITNTGITEGMGIAECPTVYTLNNVGVGQSLALAVVALTQSLCFAGGVETNCVWTRATSIAATAYITSRTDVFNLTVTSQKSHTIAAKATTAVSPNMHNFVRVNNSSFTNCQTLTGGFGLTTCKNITFTNTVYADNVQTAASTAVPLYTWYLTTNCDTIIMDGLTFAGGLATAAPYSGILYTGTGCTNVKLRNIGSATTPYDMGSRAAYVWLAGTGTTGGNSNIEIKRVYTLNTRTGLFSADNSSSGIILENVWGDEADSITAVSLNLQLKGIRGAAVTTGQTAIYGTHWQDFVYSAGNTGKLSLAFNEETTAYPSVNTVVKTQLNLPSGFNSAGIIQMPVLGDSVTWETPSYVLGHGSFTPTAPTWISTAALTVTAGSWTTQYTTLTCGTHGLSAGDTIVVTGAVPAAYNGTFVITNIVSATQVRYFQSTTPGTWSSGGNILPLDNINAYYYLDQGAGYGSKRNLKLTKTGGATTSGNAIITMTSTTGIEVGDYVTSKIAGAGASARVLSIDSSTQVTVNVNSSATTSANVLYFNHLPFESANPSTGFKLKLNLENWAQNNIAAVTNLAIATVTSATSRAYQYPLDQVTLEFTGLVSGSEIRCYTGTTADPINAIEIGGIESSGTTFSFTHSSGGVAGYIQILATGYQNITLPFTYSASNQSVPIQQNKDRQYLNPI